MREEIEDTLLMLGIFPSSKGFKPLCMAIEMAINGRTDICKGIYPEVAKELGTSAACVERNIRTAITKVYDNRYFQYGGSSFKNKDFIMTLALKIGREIKNEQN